MAQVAQKMSAPVEPPPQEPDVSAIEPRRLELADLSQHGGWLLPRILAQYPHLNERSVVGWLKSIIYLPEFLCLYLPHAVAVAQTVKTITLDPMPVVQERFVWIQNKEDVEQQRSASAFYIEFERWARNKGCEILIVEEASDVPHEMIREKLGRVFTRQQQFARL